MKEIEILKQSPMFQLSLSSKELFHSNFLYWLSIIDRHKFVELLNKVLNIVHIDSNWGSWSAKREWKHFDFCITSKEGENEIIHLVLENKFKSVPNKTQLDEYFSKSDKCQHHILLTLVDDFPYKEDVKNWKVVNYKELSNSIEDVYGNLSGYKSEIIKDYKAFVSAFHDLSVSWRIEKDNLFINTREEYGELRINDIYQKIIYGQLLANIICDLKLREQEVVWGVGKKEMFEENMEKSKNHIYVNSGLTNSQGLLEIKVKLDENTAVLIQLQGRQYRRCIERKEGTLKNNYNWLCNEADNRIRDLFSYKLGEQPLIPYPDGLCNNGEPFKKHDTAKNNKLDGFCKFGNTFIYQYIKVDDNVKVGTIIDAIISDINHFRSLVNKIGTDISE